ncbi:MAG: sugar phosphate isomerase/epimerase [Candidatus Sumerlaeota bacterium]|nr:sugar phosphate isomerase/epimerase [Candidatus Sumerlaeota bacterium]
MSAQTQQFLSRLAVCSWSLHPAGPEQLVQQMKAIGLDHVQLDLDPFNTQSAAWNQAPDIFARNGITPVSGMFRAANEDYSTLETIRITGGIVPDSTWEANWRNAQVTAKTAARLGLKFVMFHAGFLPHDPKDPAFEKLAGRVRKIARLFGEAGITLGCETGQESAAALKTFLESLNEPNVAVNFDPANMILYNNGDPVAGLRTVGRWVRGIHVKDANVTKTPGSWGEEVTVGMGQVDWPAFFNVLAEVNFPGWLCFEREAGNQRVEDIRAGRGFVEKLLSGS